MIELLVIGALLGVVVYFSIREGKSGEKLKQREELLDAVAKAEAARAAVDDPDYRKLLISELRERGKNDTLRKSSDSSD